MTLGADDTAARETPLALSGPCRQVSRFNGTVQDFRSVGSNAEMPATLVSRTRIGNVSKANA